MQILVIYDINTTDDNGKTLRNISKLCESFGQRVQDSVFLCNLSTIELEDMKNKLNTIIRDNHDNIQIYKVKYIGELGYTKKIIDYKEDLLLYI